MSIPNVTAEEREALVKVAHQSIAFSCWGMAELLSFFSLPEKNQVDVLPVFKEERKYNFPEGDFTTANSLAVLFYAYDACLNSICISLLCLSDNGFEEMEFISKLTLFGFNAYGS